MSRTIAISDRQCDFLRRFVDRGWLHGDRADPREREAVDLALRKRWLRRELSEVHFTPAGREALVPLSPARGAVMSERLKRCPCCGHNIPRLTIDADGPSITCRAGDCELRISADDHETVIQRWNRRTDPAATPASDERMSALANEYEAGLRKMEAAGYEEFGPAIDNHRLVIKALRIAAVPTSGSAVAMREALEFIDKQPLWVGNPETYAAGFQKRYNAVVERATAALAAPQAQESATSSINSDGINGCMRVAAQALDFLADHNRPVGGQSPYNAEHLIQLASELRRTSAAIDTLVSRPMHPPTENTAAGEASTPPPDR